MSDAQTEVVENSPQQKRSLAQPNDLMFERNLAIMSSKGKEVKIVTTQGEYIGYIAGLDEETIQLCITADLTLKLINRNNYDSIGETGETLEHLLGTDSDVGKKIRDRIGNFMFIATQHASSQSKKN